MYKPFHSLFVRIPSSSFNSLEQELFDTKIRKPHIQEAIYIASPVLYNELQKYLFDDDAKSEENRRIKSSLYRYINRMSARCTPFGLFAGCMLGNVSDKTQMILSNSYRKTRFDMFFLCALSQELLKLSKIREKVKYYPNSTLYLIGKKYRYIEYKYTESERIHQISSIERSIILDTILKMARHGVKTDDLFVYLFQNGIEHKDAKQFIEDLIDSQIIVSELSPSVTGDDYFTRIINILNELNVDEALLSALNIIREMLNQLDSPSNYKIILYKNIIEKIKEIKIPYEEKFLFQVDMIIKPSKVTLGKNIVEELQTTLTFLNKITLGIKNEALQQFQQAFYSRYEEREIPLLEALDPEIGIGYPINRGAGDVSPLLDNFNIPVQVNQEVMSFQSDSFHSMLLKKTIEALTQNKKEVVLNDEDVKNFLTNLDDLPPTLFTMFEILDSDPNRTMIHLLGFSGFSGANLFTRFAHTDEKIAQLVSEIATKEQELMPDVLLAEIAHLPDLRIGNILSRPHIRNYEILYLANSDLPENQLIYMSDLYLSIRKGRIRLYSKKLNKEIVPRLTSAHNYRNSSMPCYLFLCDMQHQQGRGGLFFSWGYLKNELSFLPRIRYNNTILSLSTWKIEIKEIKYLFEIKEDNKLIEETTKWREKYLLPTKVLLLDGDNELLVNWEDELSIRALFSIVKKRETINLSEFLYDSKTSVVKDENGNSYRNECIIAFYKDKIK